MSYCINPNCPKPNDAANANSPICRHCGSELLLKGRYLVMRLLSDKSGFGKIYEAFDGSTPKILKVLKEDHNTNPKAVELFQQEAVVLSQLNHPGIPRIEPDGYFQFFPRGAKEPLHCIVMEKIEGPNLKQWMQQQGNHPISADQALNWLKQLAEILHLVHEKNYFHRDIKPENIMLRPNGQLVLIDFGTAREMTYTYLAAVSGTGSITKVSSAGYTAPEQEQGHAVPQSDFYSLGRTFVYLLTGKNLTNQAIYDAIRNELNWRNFAPDLALPLANFIDDLIAPKAADRPKNTQEIIDCLAKISQEMYYAKFPASGSSNILMQSSAKVSLIPSKVIRQNKKWLLLGYVALAVALGGYGGWEFYCNSQINPIENISPVKIFTGHSSFINSLVFSPDGQILISGSADKTIKIWHLATGKEIRTIKDHNSFINYLAIAPDGQTLFSASADKTIKLWNLATGKEILTLKGHYGYVNYLAITPDGQTLVSASADKTIKLWNLSNGQAIRTLKGHLTSVNSLAISQDGKTLFSAGADKNIKIWDLATGKQIRTLTGHTSFVNYLAISLDGKKLLSASADKTIKIWDIASGKEINTLKGHTSFVSYLAMAQDGQTLISGSADKTIKMWNLYTGKEIRTLKGDFNYGNNLPISPLAISPDGHTVATGSGDKSIKIWQIPLK
ncbi:serine/threonine-protein kinase [Microseira wollei]|uniref:Serine/threonine protein kinase n=1 Tax=Microseira wollei NIES-4236 TaxID=2530354 RepID=A0AAV3XB38_9CYAN|nr:serine/threonine-protein kinase [Microseira wollei]GET39050.1 serine/threonine protein kinase [Microseira wollei NIES-4236]